MDFLTVLKNLLELVETAAMLGGLVYITRAIKLKDNPPARREMYAKGIGFMVVFLLLNLVSSFYF